MSFDIGPSLAARDAQEAGREIEIIGKDGEPTGAFLTVCGSASFAVAGFTLALQRSRVREVMRMSDNRDQEAFLAALREVEERPEELIREHVDRTATAIKGWRGLVAGGEEFPYSPENARRLMAETWIRLQVQAAMEDAEAFTSA